jgi:acetyltransferase-like isoleucine patch superfamily enzyme
MSKIKKLSAILIALTPFTIFRIFLYRALLKYDIDYTCDIGMFNIITCDSVTMRHARIGHFNQIQCQKLSMKNGSKIRNYNRIILSNIVSFSERAEIVNRNVIVGLFTRDNKNRYDCNFYLGTDSLITHRHTIDITSKVEIGENVVFGGNGTQVWTHGFDYNRNMIVKPIIIEDNIYIGSRCTIVGGVTICSNVSIAASTTISKQITEPGFYVSSVLMKKK